MSVIIGMLIGIVIGAGSMFLVYKNNKKMFEETEKSLVRKAEEIRDMAEREIYQLKEKLKKKE